MPAVVKRALSIFLALAITAFANGGLHYFHEIQEAAEDARADASAATAAKAGKPDPAEHHDESHCQICAQLHMAVIAVHWTPVVSRLGIVFALVILMAHRPAAVAASPTVSCRGPPIAPCLSLFS